jgi:hypothetical protein
MGASPLLGGLNGRGLVILPALGNVVGERVVGIGSTEEGLDREEDSADLESGGPVVYVDVLVMNISNLFTDFLLFRTSKQIRPRRSMLGW